MVSTVRQSFQNNRFNPQTFSVAALYVVYYSLAIIFWNYADQFSRFFCVIMPLLWMYFFKPLLPLLSSARDTLRGKTKVMTGIMVCVLTVLLAAWPAPDR